MANIDNIIQRIRSQAEEEISQIKNQSQSKIQEETKSILDQAKKQAEDIEDQAQKEASRLYDQRISSARLQARDEKIQRDQDLIDKVLQGAVDRLNSISDEAYLAKIEEATRDIDDDFYLAVPENRAQYLRDKGYKLSDEPVSDGFIIKTQDVDYNYRFTDQVEGQRDELARGLSSKFLDKENNNE